MEDYTQHWLKIKKKREDITDYLIHWTSSIETLQSILNCGFLRPTFAPRKSSLSGGDSKATIRGTRRAVCFTEQPLSAFIRSCKALPGRYRPYGIAVRKERLFEYGGRPCIYGDLDLLNSLPSEFKHLWVGFQPYPDPDRNGYPIDWTHEREWRATVNEYEVPCFGYYDLEGVPLLLPPDIVTEKLLLPWILVSTEAEAADTRKWIQDLPDYDGENEMMRQYRTNLPWAPVVPLNTVEMKLAKGCISWAKLDSLPYLELDPLSQLTRVGWSEIPQT